ncbi:MAG: hypothetical protein JW840_07945 [Candidatus Thermoplasmatota archaeon]|nr:hypothetical protein [Candidatus Thermoplasmatota archaeon]
MTGILGILLFLVTIPITTGNIKSGDDFNLKADVQPWRRAFPHIYAPFVKAQFVTSYRRDSGSYPGGDTYTFQVIRCADDKVVYSEEREMKALSEPQTGSGSMIEYTCNSGIRRFVSLYEVRITLNVDDNNPSDNVASCYFIVIENI